MSSGDGRGRQRRLAKQQKKLVKDQRRQLRQEQSRAVREQQRRLTSMAGGLRGRTGLLSSGFAGFLLDEDEEGNRMLGG